MTNYDYFTKGICDIPDENDDNTPQFVNFNPVTDDRKEIIDEARKTGKPVVITSSRVKHFWDFFRRNAHREILVLYGGSGGGKSHSVNQYLIDKLFTIPNIKIAMYRKSGSSLRASVIDMCLEIIQNEGYIEGIDYIYNKTNRILTSIQSKSTMEFKSLDAPHKIKSTKYNFANMEELTEFTLADLMMVQNTLRKSNEGVVNQLFVTFNPVDANHWVWAQWLTGIVANDPDELEKVGVNHSTYINNVHLPAQYVRKLENSIKYDENFYRVYALGLPGILANIVYTNWSQINPKDFPKYGDFFYGIDFGFNNPMAVVECCRGVEDTIYTHEILYQSQLTTADLIEYLNNNYPEIKRNGYPLYCDNAEPDRIKQIQEAGYMATPAKKGIIAGIDRVKKFKILISSNSVNMIREIANYHYSVDKNGIVLEIPVKIADHCTDALSYAIGEHMSGYIDNWDYISLKDTFYMPR